MKTTQVRMGHSDSRLTLALYAQAVPEADQAAADRLSGRFMPASLDKPQWTESGQIQQVTKMAFDQGKYRWR